MGPRKLFGTRFGFTDPTFLVVADRRRDLYEIGRVQKLSAVITSLNGSGEFFGF